MTTARKTASPRKAAAKKASPRTVARKTGAQKAAEEQAVAEQQLRDDAQRARDNLASFEAYRARARARLGDTEHKQIIPFILGADQGFDPPVVITMPEATKNQLAIDELASAGKPIAAMRLMFNGRPDDFDRVLDTFDAQVKLLRADGDKLTTAELVIALWLRVLDHFNSQIGAGATDVPGGSSGS